MPSWLTILISVLEAVLQGLIAHPPTTGLEADGVAHAANVAKAQKAVDVLKEV